MALITTNGQYIKVTGASENSEHVRFLIFKDAEQRSRYPNLDTFEQYVTDSVYSADIAGLLNGTADAEKTIQQNVLTACYAALKLNPSFSDAVDA